MMQRLFRTYLDIALWRKGPQDLPASPQLCVLTGLAYVVISFMHVRLMRYSLPHSVAMAVVDVAMLLAWVVFLLTFFSRMRRFTQTFNALLGVGILLGMLDLLVMSLLHMAGGGRDLAVEWALLKLVVLALVLGRILTQAIDRGMFTGVGLVLAIVLSTDAVADLVLRQL